ncbi:LysR family transcriptional regulator [Steroidobacter agaridevorans]|uniref:LysR family transcriptional regulator n=1 Tax=Steroidobacter agaridevorans TaxID=2695856 RepID=A0A829YH12_9GAMM|nr:LysR substrate-binding domain-containing protein [Steroidobacter agaridevorans]GFE82755.1 LysR family transcriptional regulator [Steroidobacter agaridevorans]
MPTSQRLPSLHTLHVFETTARRRSFTRAAEELHLTQAAVSRQIRQLEEALEQPLFIRMHRRVELTPVGERLAADLSHSFMQIARSVAQARGETRERLRLSVEPAFAARWLLPRLPRFVASEPQIDVEVDSTEIMRELGSETDMAIRYIEGPRRSPQRSAILVEEVAMFPVLAPSLLRPGQSLRTPEDLLQYPLLHEDEDRSWQAWFRAAGLPGISIPRRMRFNDVALVLQAAANGHGIALGDDLLAGDDLKAGRLIKPFEITAPCGTYWLLGGSSRSRARRTFRDWLAEQLTH